MFLGGGGGGGWGGGGVVVGVRRCVCGCVWGGGKVRAAVAVAVGGVGESGCVWWQSLRPPPHSYGADGAQCRPH